MHPMEALKKYPLAFASILIIGFVIGFAVSSYVPKSSTEFSDEKGSASMEDTKDSSPEKEASGPALISGDGDVSVSDQPAGRAVVVDAATLPAIGWIVVHELRGGEIGNALGAARREAGAHQRVVVDLLRGTEPEKSYAVVLYADNGNREFDLRADALFEKNGSVIMDQFVATIPVAPAGN